MGFTASVTGLDWDLNLHRPITALNQCTITEAVRPSLSDRLDWDLNLHCLIITLDWCATLQLGSKLTMYNHVLSLHKCHSCFIYLGPFGRALNSSRNISDPDSLRKRFGRWIKVTLPFGWKNQNHCETTFSWFLAPRHPYISTYDVCPLLSRP